MKKMFSSFSFSVLLSFVLLALVNVCRGEATLDDLLAELRGIHGSVSQDENDTPVASALYNIDALLLAIAGYTDGINYFAEEIRDSAAYISGYVVEELGPVVEGSAEFIELLSDTVSEDHVRTDDKWLRQSFDATADAIRVIGADTFDVNVVSSESAPVVVSGTVTADAGEWQEPETNVTEDVISKSDVSGDPDDPDSLKIDNDDFVGSFKLSDWSDYKGSFGLASPRDITTTNGMMFYHATKQSGGIFKPSGRIKSDSLAGFVEDQTVNLPSFATAFVIPSVDLDNFYQNRVGLDPSESQEAFLVWQNELYFSGNALKHLTPLTLNDIDGTTGYALVSGVRPFKEYPTEEHFGVGIPPVIEAKLGLDLRTCLRGISTVGAFCTCVWVVFSWRHNPDGSGTKFNAKDHV